MSTTTLVKFITPTTEESIRPFFDEEGIERAQVLQGISKLCNALANGSRNGSVSVSLNETRDTKATATITITGAATAADTVTVNGVVFYARASADAAVASDYTLSATPTTAATNLAAKINAHPSLAGIVTASPHLGVITLTSGLRGANGNAITLAESSANLTVSGSVLSGGAETAEAAASFTVTFTDVAVADDTVVIGATTLTAKASPSTNQFLVGTGSATDQANILASAINSHATLGALWTATHAAGVITVTAKTPGIWANTVPLSETLTNGSLSGAYPTGGVDRSVAASAVLTVQTGGLLQAATADSITIGTVTLLPKTSPSGATQFLEHATETTAATNLTNCINANATLSAIVTASAIGTQVLIVAKQKGALGNQVALASAGSRLGGSAWSSTYLAGGVDPGYQVSAKN